MDIVNETPWQVGFLAGRIGFPKHSLTLIVKGTFDLRPGGVVELAAEQRYPTGDEPYPDAEEQTGGPRYSSDFAHFKPKADVLVVGKCHPPKGPASSCDVSVRVGEIHYALRVFGDRLRQGRKISEPERFDNLELRWENSLGGSADERNPIGKGAVLDGRSGEPVPMPNIFDPAQPTVPAGFGPRSHLWKDRAGRLGTYGDDYLDSRWPWFAADFNPAYYNAAVPALQIAGYLDGDEKIRLGHLHPEHGIYETELPSLRPRCFLNEATVAPRPDARPGRALREVPMRLDTLWVDTEAEQLVLVWRGLAEVPSEELEQILHLFVVSEALSREPSALEVYEGWLRERCAELDLPFAPETAATAGELPKTGATAWLGLFTTTVMQMTTDLFGGRPSEMPAPSPAEEEAGALFGGRVLVGTWTRERVLQAAKAGESLTDADLADLDLSGLDLSGASFVGATLTGANLSGAILSGVDLSGATLLGADLSKAKLNGACLNGADLSEALLRSADLTGAQLSDAIVEKADLDRARLTEATATDASFGEALLTKTDFTKADLARANFSRATLVKAIFIDASLREATIEKATGASVDMSRADLSELRAADASLAGGRFERATAPESIWVGANLQKADFSRANLSKADLESADLESAILFGADARGAKLPKAKLSRAKLTAMNLFEADLEKADLTKADLRRSSLFAAQLQDTVLTGAKLREANLGRTKLAGREK